MAKKKKRTVKKPKAVSRKAQKKQKLKVNVPVSKNSVKKAITKKHAAPEKIHVGNVTHYFTNIGVSVVKLTKPLEIGDKISIHGATTNFGQKVQSMQIEKEPVSQAKKGDVIGLKVKKRVREHDKVYLVK